MDDAQILKLAGLEQLPKEHAVGFVEALRAEAERRTGFLAGPKKRAAVLNAVIAEAAANRKAALGE